MPAWPYFFASFSPLLRKSEATTQNLDYRCIKRLINLSWWTDQLSNRGNSTYLILHGTQFLNMLNSRDIYDSLGTRGDIYKDVIKEIQVSPLVGMGIGGLRKSMARGFSLTISFLTSLLHLEFPQVSGWS